MIRKIKAEMVAQTIDSILYIFLCPPNFTDLIPDQTEINRKTSGIPIDKMYSASEDADIHFLKVIK